MDIFSEELVNFLNTLHDTFEKKRKQLLIDRKENSKNFGFQPETLHIRCDPMWNGSSIPKDLMDRSVEITGPPHAKMIINAMKSGANVYMADLEDSTSPTWENIVNGHKNLIKTVRRDLRLYDKKQYEICESDNLATLMVRPRGWHMIEKNFTVEGEPISAALFDFGVFFFHNAKELIRRGSGPYFYLPKMEHYKEARLWNEVFQFSEKYISLPLYTIRVTCLIETFPAIFQVEEIIYELRRYIIGLNSGRWDYLFSWIKTFKDDPTYVLGSRSTLTMDLPFLETYTKLLVNVCHKRGIYAMGGMSAFIPRKDNIEENEKVFRKVQEDKLRERRLGFDGTWVAHPGLIPIAKECFSIPNNNKNNNNEISIENLMKIPPLEISELDIIKNLNISLQYIQAWLSGSGCIAIDHLMEDAATAEICRCQIWSWIKHGHIKKEIVEDVLSEMKTEQNKKEINILKEIIFSDELHEFLTTFLYDLL